MKEIKNEIDINASPSQIWKVLTDFDHYSDWNPYIIKASGKALPGQTIHLTMLPPGGKQTTVKRILIVAELNKKLHWQGFYGMGGLFDEDSTFIIEEVEPNRIHLIQHATYNGFLVPFKWKNFSESAKAGFKVMIKALKAQVEKKIEA
jgi:hypothetical protein